MKIRELSISARARMCLLTAGYEDIEELRDITDEELLEIRNLNVKGVTEIRAAIEAYFIEEEDESEKDLEDEFKDITNNDMHVIEAIGLGEGNNMSTIAKKLNITVGSLTTAVNSLVKKGYVDRFRSKEDRRVVYVRLLEKGENAYHHHEDYHKQMTQAIVDKLDESEIPVLLKTLDALTGFFTDYTRESKEKSSDSMDKE